MIYKPHDYQKYATDYILSHPATCLMLDMGLGKTVITLTALWELILDRFDVSRVLIVAPKRVAEDTWPRELSKWEHLSGLTYSLVLGSKEKREQALEKSAFLYITNRENLCWLVENHKWNFDMVVLDELSSFKSNRAQRFKAMKKVRPLVKRIVGLTGTPAPNSLMDLWAEMYLMDMGQRLGRFITGYRNRYFVPDKRNHDAFKKDMVVSIKDTDLDAVNAAALSGKLLQMANGAVYTEDKSVMPIHSKKLDALEDLVEAANGKPLLVAYWYKHDLVRLQERFKEARVIDKPADIADWNAGKITIGLIHPAAASHGLNLQEGGCTIVWFGLTWSLELYQQLNARLWRQGQRETVVIHHIVTKGTIDEDVLKALEKKDAGQSALIDAVRAQIGGRA